MSSYSYVYGPLFLILGFLICIIVVVGVKSFYYYVKDNFFTVKNIKSEKPKQPSHKKKPARSIEFNADEIDKIYFRKSS